MPKLRTASRQRELNDLLRRDHTLNGGILVGLDGHVVEVQARAVKVLDRPCAWNSPCHKISGMATGAAKEVKDRIAGAFAKLGIPESEVEILVNLAPADLYKGGTWLDLPLAIILLQASGYLPDLPEHTEGEFILLGEVGLHGELRRVPGALSLAYVAKPGQKLIVPCGNEKECALILAKPGHEGCAVYAVGLLDEVIDFFRGKRTLDNALSQKIQFENHIPKATDFGLVRGQDKAKRAAVIAAAGGHNLLMFGPFTPPRSNLLAVSSLSQPAGPNLIGEWSSGRLDAGLRFGPHPRCVGTDARYKSPTAGSLVHLKPFGSSPPRRSYPGNPGYRVGCRITLRSEDLERRICESVSDNCGLTASPLPSPFDASHASRNPGVRGRAPIPSFARRILPAPHCREKS